MFMMILIPKTASAMHIMVDLLSALRRLRIPRILVELIGLVYRFVFVLLDTVNEINIAQSCRLGYSSLSSSYRSLETMVSMVFVKSYKQSDALYTASEERGYDSELNVLSENYESRWSWYVSAVDVNILMVLLAIALRSATGCSQHEIPVRACLPGRYPFRQSNSNGGRYCHTEYIEKQSRYMRGNRSESRIAEKSVCGGRKYEIPLTVNSVGSLLSAFFTAGPVRDYKSAVKSDTKRFAAYFASMLERGIFVAPS